MAHKPPRDAKGRILPGHSLNPSGKPKGAGLIARRIMELTGNGEEIVDFLLSMMRGNNPGGASPKLRLQAAQELLNRSIGKPSENVTISKGEAPPTVIDVSGWSVEDLEAAEALHRRISGQLQYMPKDKSDDGD